MEKFQKVRVENIKPFECQDQTRQNMVAIVSFTTSFTKLKFRLSHDVGIMVIVQPGA